MKLERSGVGVVALVAILVGWAGCGSADGTGADKSAEQIAPATDPAADRKPASSRANGTIGAWQSVTALTTPRANHCAAQIGDFLVVVGGNYKPEGQSQFVSLDDVLVARVAKD